MFKVLVFNVFVVQCLSLSVLVFIVFGPSINDVTHLGGRGVGNL